MSEHKNDLSCTNVQHKCMTLLIFNWQNASEENTYKRLSEMVGLSDELSIRISCEMRKDFVPKQGFANKVVQILVDDLFPKKQIALEECNQNQDQDAIENPRYGRAALFLSALFVGGFVGFVFGVVAGVGV